MIPGNYPASIMVITRVTTRLGGHGSLRSQEYLDLAARVRAAARVKAAIAAADPCSAGRRPSTRG